MAINGINGPGFNPYGGAGATRTGEVAPRTAVPTRAPGGDTAAGNQAVTHSHAAPQKSVADAIKSDASARAAQVQSAEAPNGVDQELWSVLTKEERSFFVKAGAMGPLTYGRFSAAQGTPPAPMLRGGRLDIKA